MATAMQLVKYFFPLIPFWILFKGLTLGGWWAWGLAIFSYGFIPLVELLIEPDEHNITKMEEEIRRDDPWYDYMLWLFIPLIYYAQFTYWAKMADADLDYFTQAGLVLSMTLVNAFSINLGHELGHRSNLFEQRLSKLTYLSLLIQHFFIEHVRWHHKMVATTEDHASAPKGENVYAHMIKSSIKSYFNAWRLANKAMRSKGKFVFGPENEMVQFMVVQSAFVYLVYYLFGMRSMVFFLITSYQGWCLLELINYIEHYGLRRRREKDGSWETVKPYHSWNSNHLLGRILLFELSRHSDHHFDSSRKYQILNAHKGVPEFPTGYPGMMMLALCPPVWWYVMNPLVDKWL